jgi:nicotinate phosphoribosyltransferase
MNIPELTRASALFLLKKFSKRAMIRLNMTNDFITKKDLPLFTTGSRFMIGSILFDKKLDHKRATFDLYVRELPKHRNYLVFAGLPSVLEYLLNFQFTAKQIAWLNANYHLDKKFKNALKKFKFTGDVSALKEGTIFFPNEPILRVTSSLLEVSFIEMYLINALYFPIIFASKLSRFLEATDGKEAVVAYNRSYGVETVLKAERIKEMILGNIKGVALYPYRANIPAFSTGTYHYFIKTFKKEVDAMRAYLTFTKGQGYVLVDTYDTVHGIENYITVAKELKQKGIRVTGIQLDSGDLYEQSCLARKRLDEEGLGYAKIWAMGNLNEYKVAELVKKQAPIDVYAGGTEISTPTDSPTLELVYKLSELEENGKIIPKMKTSAGKVSLPGCKQIFRLEKNGQYLKDIIGLEGENLSGKPLLLPMVKKGQLVYKLPSLKEIRKYFLKEKQKFNPALFDIKKTFDYPITISDKLQKLTKQTREEIERSHKQ